MLGRDIYMTFPSARTAADAVRRLRERRPNAHLERDRGSNVVRITRTHEAASHYTEVLGMSTPVIRIV